MENVTAVVEPYYYLGIICIVGEKFFQTDRAYIVGPRNLFHNVFYLWTFILVNINAGILRLVLKSLAGLII